MPPRSQLPRKRRTVHPVLFLVLLAALILLAIWSIERYRHRFVRTNSGIQRLLPSGDVTTFYANFDVLRASGYLQLFANSSTADPEYRRFVEETNFDFTRDLDALAGAWKKDRLDLFLKGHLDWSRFRSYVAHHNGRCGGSSCTVASSHAGRYLSFTELQPDVMVAVIGPDSSASERFAVASSLAGSSPQGDPVWLRPATSVLRSPAGLPLALRVFAIALQSAQSVTMSLGASKTVAFDLNLRAEFERPFVAEGARKQLEIDTKALQLELAREHAAVNPANLTGLLIAGRFWTQDSSLYGAWPVHKEFLTALR